jgi:hypothetical protein
MPGHHTEEYSANASRNAGKTRPIDSHVSHDQPIVRRFRLRRRNSDHHKAHGEQSKQKASAFKEAN